MVYRVRMSYDRFIGEVDRWFDLRHPNVVEIFGASDIRQRNSFSMHKSSHRFVSVCENALSTNLREYLYDDSSSDDRRHLLWQKLYEVALGVKYLHERGIILGSLPCGSVWIGTDGLAKIAGFGIGSFGDDLESVRWKAPECLRGDSPCAASDIYSLAMCIVEAVTRTIPWVNETNDRVEVKVVQGCLPECSEALSESQLRLLDKMWLCDPSRRINIVAVVEHLREFAEPTTTVKGEAYPESVVFDLEEYLVPGYTFTIRHFLDKLKSKCEKGEGSRTSALEIHARLVDVYARLQEVDSLRRQLGMSKYCEILQNLNELLGNPTSEKSMYQRAKSQKVSFQNNVLHRQIDEVLDLLGVARNDSLRSWKTKEAKDHIEGHEKGETIPGMPDAKCPRTTPADKETTTVLSDEVGTSTATTAVQDVKLEHFDSEYLNQKFKRIDIDGTEANHQEASHPAWLISIDELDFKRDQQIGEGAFGAVYKASWLGTPVVVKYVGYEDDGGEHSRELFLHEIRIWYPLSHPHVVKLFGACHIGKRYFVCEYAPNGTLREYLKQGENCNKKWKKLHEVSLGLQYLHEENILHNDLKGDNFLIGADGNAKVTDFGLSCIPNSVEVKVDPKKQGAVQWKSPECLRGRRLTLASDIYSLGMCILEAVTGCFPWGNMPDAVVRYHVRNGRLPLRPDLMDDAQWHLIEMMCEKDPSQRLKISSVVERLHEFSQQGSAMEASVPSGSPTAP